MKINCYHPSIITIKGAEYCEQCGRAITGQQYLLPFVGAQLRELREQVENLVARGVLAKIPPKLLTSDCEEHSTLCDGVDDGERHRANHHSRRHEAESCPGGIDD